MTAYQELAEGLARRSPATGISTVLIPAGLLLLRDEYHETGKYLFLAGGISFYIRPGIGQN